MSLANDKWIRFLNEIKSAKHDLGEDEVIWYRGQNNFNHYLLPSLLRYENGIDKEKYLFSSFKKFSDRILVKRVSEWETLFTMQHYEIPTRLLDWSETFGIALFFAAYYNNKNKEPVDAAIYLLNPKKLNEISGISKVYKIPEEETEFPYINIYWNHRPFSARAPVAIEPIFINDRMLAQRGMFTVYDDSIDPIEVKYPSFIRKIQLDNDIIPVALEFLELANINAYTIYPDLPGIADYLRRTSDLKYRWQ